MKRLLTIIMLMVTTALLSGCSVTLHILSNNNLFTTRSQASASGMQEGLVEGGGNTDLEASVPLR